MAGELRGGGSTWVPAVHARAQQEAVLTFFRSGSTHDSLICTAGVTHCSFERLPDTPQRVLLVFTGNCRCAVATAPAACSCAAASGCSELHLSGVPRLLLRHDLACPGPPLIDRPALSAALGTWNDIVAYTGKPERLPEFQRPATCIRFTGVVHLCSSGLSYSHHLMAYSVV